MTIEFNETIEFANWLEAVRDPFVKVRVVKRVRWLKPEILATANQWGMECLKCGSITALGIAFTSPAETKWFIYY